jgi:hypothetical protein
MIKVKVTHPYGNWPLARQTPNNSGIWGDCQFFINDDTQECDYWFVFDDLLKEESVICNPKNTVIITLEFPEIRPDINLRFLKQFSTIFSYSRQIKHPRVIEVVAPFPWHIGIDNTNSNTVSSNYKIYDDFKSKDIINKPKLMSVISSSKKYTDGHRKRLKFVEALKDYFGNGIDVFGRGINDFADKWDVIYPYKYHISLENSSCTNGISEKLYDSFLGGAFPFYYGCPNVNDYFPSQSLVSIDISDINQSLKIIDKSIANQLYEKSIDFIQDSKMLVLTKYNVFELIDSYCKNDLASQKNSHPKSLTRFYAEAYFNNSKIDKIKNSINKYLNPFKRLRLML